MALLVVIERKNMYKKVNIYILYSCYNKTTVFDLNSRELTVFILLEIPTQCVLDVSYFWSYWFSMTLSAGFAFISQF